MKRVYFQLGAMNVGGVEKSFLGLLTTLPRNEYEIHLGLLSTKGGYMDFIPDYVHVHKIDCYEPLKRVINDPPLACIKDFFLHGHFIEALIHFFLYVRFKFNGNRYLFYKYILRNIPIESTEYDVAIAYAGPSQMIDFYVCEKIKAKMKYGWIHFDVTKFGIDRGMTRRLYKQYEKVFVVSETAKKRFDELLPELKEKTEVRYNVVSKEQILSLADTGKSFDDDYHGKRILTVGRLSSEKGQDVSVEALKKLVDEGRDVKWYYVGEGNLRNVCKQKAKELGISERVVFLGLQTNPYGYMRDCDIYVQPSRHEGYCITLAEARCFTAPIVATNFTGAEEQLNSYPQSVVTGMSANDIADGIMRFL